MAKDQPFKLEATYAPVSKRPSSRSVEMRSLAQKSAYKDLGRDGLSPGHHAQGHLYSDF